MNQFKVVFNWEKENSFIEEDSVSYYLWAILDISINGKSFFYKFKDDFYEETSDYIENKMTNSTISKKGITVPTIPIIESTIEMLKKIEKKKELEIEDSTGQIDKKIVCRLKENKIIFAIKQEGWLLRKGIWYDGETLSQSKNIPISHYNVVEYNDFKLGFLVGIRRYIQSVLKVHPNLINSLELNKVIELLNKNFKYDIL